MTKSNERDLSLTEIVNEGDYVLWLPPDAWTSVDKGSEFIGKKVQELKDSSGNQLKFKRFKEV